MNTCKACGYSHMPGVTSGSWNGSPVGDEPFIVLDAIFTETDRRNVRTYYAIACPKCMTLRLAGRSKWYTTTISKTT